MMDLTSDALLKRWKGQWPATETASMSGNTGHTLQSWLEKAYLEGNKSKDFSQKDIEKVGEIVGQLLVFEPNARASAADVLRDPWFHYEY
jgi:serine/threonine-protein kinase SRPK3